VTVQSLALAGVARNYHHQFAGHVGLLDVEYTIVDDADVVVAAGACVELSSGVYVTGTKVTLPAAGGYAILFESAGAGVWADYPIRCVRKVGAG
jgi:hypothetical protein